MTNSRSVTLTVLLALVLTVAACAPDTDGNKTGTTEISGDSFLLRGNSGEPGTLDPHLARKPVEMIIINDLFIGLLAHDANGNVVAGSAASYRVSEDGLNWIFALRDDLRWSDGVAITADDFVYSFRRAMDPATAAPMASLLYSIKGARAVNAGETAPDTLGVSAPDAKTVVITLEKPTPYFHLLMVIAPALPVPRHIIEQHGQGWSRPPNAVSNGAFKVTSWNPRVDVLAEKNDQFFEHDMVKLAGVRYLPTEDLSTQLKRFRAGELDIGLNFPPSQLEWVKENLADSIRMFPIYGTYYYPFNLKSKKLSDVRVRQALNMAIDREIITEKLLGARETPTFTFVPPGFEHYTSPPTPEWSKLAMPERQRQAIQLLSDAGYNETKPLSLEVRYNMTEEHQAIAVGIANMWKAVGVKTDLHSSETRAHYKDLAIGEFEVGRMAMFPNYPDPNGFLEAFASDNKSDNYTGYSNPVYDQLLAEANAVMDPVVRARKLSDAEALMLADYPILPLYHYVSKRLVSTRVKGWHNNPVGTHPSRYFWLEEKQ